MDRQVNKALELAELDDLVEPTVNLVLAQAVDRRAQVDVVAAGEVRVEAGTEPSREPTCPATARWPLVGRKIPASSLRSVVFPDPFRPMNPTDSPGSIRNDTPRRAHTTGRKCRRRTIASFRVTCRCG